MKYRKVHVEGFGYELAPVVVTSEELEERLAPVYRALHVPQGQLERMTGIRERRFWDPGASIVDGATVAATRVLRTTEIPAASIEALVYAGVCREHFEPATACHVASRLAQAGLALPPHATLHDLSNACLGVLSGIIDLANRIELGQIRAGMVVACESAREINEAATAQLLADPSMPRFLRSMATFTGGSAAIAVIVSDGSFGAPARRRLVAATIASAPQHDDLCRWGVQPRAGHQLEPFIATDASAVLEHGVELGAHTWSRFRSVLGARDPIVDRTICHQVGATHRATILARLGLTAEHDFVAYEELGNTGSVALPLAAALAEQRGFLRPGHRVGWLGIGSGLNCLMLGIDW